jgi:hypothetical protein
MRFYVSLYLFVAGLYLLTASGRIGLSDGVAMYSVAQSVIDKGSFSSDPCEPDLNDLATGSSVGCVPGKNGQHYAGFGLLPSVLVVPAILGARAVAEVVHVNPAVTTKAGASLFTLMVAPLVCLVLAAWIVKLGYNRWTAAAAAGILAFASPFWHFSVKGFFSEPYFTLGILLAAYLLSGPRNRFSYALAGLAFGLACLARLNGVILFPAYILALAFYNQTHKLSAKEFLRDALAFSASFSVCAALIAGANFSRFGSPFKTGYHVAFPTGSSMLSTPLFSGLSRILFSGEIGLIVFAPWIMVALFCFPRFFREHRSEAALCGASSLIYVLFFAKFSHSEGGWVAGPRYLVPVLPFLIMAMAPVIQQLQLSTSWKLRPWSVIGPVLVVLVGAGFLIQSVGSMFPDERYYSLREFYSYKAAKPWWSGSIPLASVDFLSRMSIKSSQPSRGDFDQATTRHERERAFASANSAVTEGDYLDRGPNPVNMTAPNLLLIKFRLMGLPAFVPIAYLLFALALSFAGAFGLRRSIAL